MSNNYILDNYNITTTLTELSVYIRVMNNISFQSYESTVHLRDINLPFEKRQIYDIICNCFERKPDYDTTITVKNNGITVAFDITFNGAFKTNFSLILPEKKMTEDGNLTISINKIEIEYKKEIEILKSKIEKLEKIIESIGHTTGFMNLKLGETKEINIDNNWNHKGIESIKSFFNLETLTIMNTNNILDNISFQNNSLNKIIFSSWVNNLKSFNGIENLPNLETIEIIGGIGLKSEYPYIKEQFDKVKKLKKVIYRGCSANYLSQKDYIIDYCKKNNIAIEII